ADRARRQVPAREQPRVRPVERLVAALVVEEAVVADDEREDGERRPLRDREQAEDREPLAPRAGEDAERAGLERQRMEAHPPRASISPAYRSEEHTSELQ